MSIASALAAGRRAAESRFGFENGGSTATVWREDPEDPVVVDGLSTANWVMEYSTLNGRIAGTRGGAAQTRTVTIGQTEMQLAVREWHCPVGTELRDGDLIEVISGENEGVYLRVVESAGKDQATACRVPVVETQKPEGL